MRKATVLGLALAVALLAVALPGIGRVQAQGALAGQHICLDPGHGGTDPGATNEPFGLEEADINLDVAFGLKALLEYDGAMVVMTRTDDRYLTNSDRYTFCNAEKATLLISVHTNSVSDPTWDGSQTLYFKKEDLALAQAVHPVLYQYLLTGAPDQVAFRDLGLNQYASGVLLKSDMPAIMPEPLFMSCPDEAQELTVTIHAVDAEGVALLDATGDPMPNPECMGCRRAQIAQAIHAGVLAYVESGGEGGDDGGDNGGQGGPPCANPPCRK
ncbi:MAG: N-acetylmuramoyl-L-alanine amidase [Anaerolineae bacterium]|nr:N-acetylmuramoyl-L-alanine amidase [Anaerolineae bacterium]